MKTNDEQNKLFLKILKRGFEIIDPVNNHTNIFWLDNVHFFISRQKCSENDINDELIKQNLIKKFNLFDIRFIGKNSSNLIYFILNNNSMISLKTLPSVRDKLVSKFRDILEWKKKHHLLNIVEYNKIIVLPGDITKLDFI